MGQSLTTVKTVLEAAASILFEEFCCGLYLRAAFITNLPKNYVKESPNTLFMSKKEVFSTELAKINANAAYI